MLRIFISSVQKEFVAERAALRDYLRGDPLMRRFFEPFFFEDVPAADHHADEVYLDEVARCDVYLTQYIERMGTGTGDMIERCQKAGLPEPEFTLTDGFVTTLRRIPNRAFELVGGKITPPVTGEVAGEVTGEVEAQAAQAALVAGQVTGQVARGGEAQEAQAEAQEAQAGLTPTEIILLNTCSPDPALGQALLQAAGYRERTGNFKRSLEKLLAVHFLELTLPDKPTSPKQKYRLTPQGRAWLDKTGPAT
jgi:ATP-dependent DNA helicase RecG